MKQVYIVGTGEFLPNEPVENDAIPSHLGLVSPGLERVRHAVLRQNGIGQRYYAADSSGRPTHTATEMACRAVLAACEAANRPLESVDFLTAGSTIPDLFLPSFASMCHGWLGPHGIKSIHVHPVSGICCIATHALEAAHLYLSSGRHSNAIVTTGERASAGMQAERYLKEYPARNENTRNSDCYQYFDAEFLRYMLSDGGGALYLTTQPRPDEHALRIDWIESISYSNVLPTCMYAGDIEPDTYSPSGSWITQPLDIAASSGLLVLRQNTDILRQHAVSQLFSFIESLVSRDILNFDNVDLIAAHLSSRFFVEEIARRASELDPIKLPVDKFYTNMKDKGNMGSASPLILLHDVYSKRLLKPGQTGLLICPESGRFSYSICQFTAI